MSSELERAEELRSTKRRNKVGQIAEFGLSSAISRTGGELVGFSVRLTGGDCLLTLRVTLAGRPQIAYVGGETLGSALLKAYRDASSDKLQWKDCKYRS